MFFCKELGIMQPIRSILVCHLQARVNYPHIYIMVRNLCNEEFYEIKIKKQGIAGTRHMCVSHLNALKCKMLFIELGIYY